jgi:glucose-6-phosphate 1-dehydrogenase
VSNSSGRCKQCFTTLSSNYFRFRLSPAVFISAGAHVKTPGEAIVGEEVELISRQHPGAEMTPYERLLGDAIRGDASLFAHSVAGD